VLLPFVVDLLYLLGQLLIVSLLAYLTVLEIFKFPPNQGSWRFVGISSKSLVFYQDRHACRLSRNASSILANFCSRFPSTGLCGSGGLS
jgi:hypothetical protein